MEKVNFGYSVKNIPIPDGKSYKLQLIQKVEDFIKKIRWKVTFFMKGENQIEPTTHKTGLTFGLNSTKCPPQIKELVPFEEDFIKLIKNLRFRKVDNKFQRALAKDLKDIRSSKKTLTAADKTLNIYRLSKEEYSNLLQNAITSKYKKTDKHTATNINKEGIKHAKEGSIIDRIEVNGTSNSFITLTDHKENFLNRPTTRLPNPAKNEIGRISKRILQNINTTLSEKIKVNEWKNTESVISCLISRISIHQ